jgi:putative transposase
MITPIQNQCLEHYPQYPDKPFESTELALEWVRKFVGWYNNVHQHSGINFVTPNARHNEEDQAILTNRTKIYELAKQKNPSRWSGKTRNWARVDEVLLNTKRTSRKAA